MIAPTDLFVSQDDCARIARHTAYLKAVRASDPQRASILQELLDATYRYANIADGDILLALDCDLYDSLVVTA